MAGFKVTKKTDENGNIRLRFEGAMDEHSNYSVIDMSFSGEVVFDFDDVDHINSTGIKHWVQWISKVQTVFKDLKFTFINCPKPIVDQINMVDGFLPPHSKVKSFKVPYYCETCDKDAVHTFVYGREYDKSAGALKINMPIKKCDQPQCSMEPDVVEQKYFKFLK